MAKRQNNASVESDAPPVKIKKTDVKSPKKEKFENEKTSKFTKKKKQIDSKRPTVKKFTKNGQTKSSVDLAEKPEDWNEFKKQKKELRLKRKQNKGGFDVIIKAKKLGEKLRCKLFKGGEVERNKLINELHKLLKGENHYAKFVLSHDTSRIVQWLLKYSSDIVKEQISKELIPVSLEMLQSKYGIHCIKRLLKYGNDKTKSAIIKSMYGNAVKLTNHSLSAPVFEYAYSTWATPLQKQHLVQEFFGDLYKKSKDNNVKHLRDVFKDNPTLKAAILSATKANLLRILNKNLLDSGLVQTVLSQYLTECSNEEKCEMISQLVQHIVVISNSKDGARAAMQCIWHGTNKDRKVAMKALKEHVIELSKHEHGHCTVITLLDTVDDTVLLNKLIISEILGSACDLAINEWGRKVLLWLVAPADSTCFHPLFIKELETGLKSSNSKKSAEIRRKEILGYASQILLDLIISNAGFWLSTSSLAYEMLAIVKMGSGDDLAKTYKSIIDIIVNSDWKIKFKDDNILGIEHPGIHMVLKKLAQYDKINLENNKPTFGALFVEALDDEILKLWIPLNRGCFILVTVYENNSEATQLILKNKLLGVKKLLKKQNSTGAKILLKKLS